MKDGDKLVTQANMMALEKLADIRDLNAKKTQAGYMAGNKQGDKIMKYAFLNPDRRKALAGKCRRCGGTHLTELGELVCQNSEIEEKYCDTCQRATELRYCPETDCYHCEDCQDEDKKYTEYIYQEVK